MKKLLLLFILIAATQIGKAQTMTLSGIVIYDETNPVTIIGDQFVFDTVPDFAYLIKEVTVLLPSGFPAPHGRHFVGDPAVDARLLEIARKTDETGDSYYRNNHHGYEAVIVQNGMPYVDASFFHKQGQYNFSAFCGFMVVDSTPCAVVLFRFDPP